MTTMIKMNKTVGKFKLWAILSALVIVAGIVILAVFGFNPDTTVSDVKTLSVELESYVDISDARVESVKEICESEFEKAGLKDAYTVKADMSNGGELLYVFDKNTDDAKLNEAKDAIGAALNAASEGDGALSGAFFYVSTGSENAIAVVPSGYIWRGALAGAVILLVIFVYVSVRYKLNMGIAGTVSSLVGALLTLAVVALVRIPVTTSVAYIGAFALLFTALTSMLTFNKMRENFKTDEYKAMSAEEAVSSSVQTKSVLFFALLSIIALVLVGAIAVTSVRWFAVAALVAVVMGTFSSLIFMPAMYLPMKKISDKRAAERARYDYKKGAKSVKAAAKADAKTDAKAETQSAADAEKNSADESAE